MMPHKIIMEASQWTATIVITIWRVCEDEHAASHSDYRDCGFGCYVRLFLSHRNRIFITEQNPNQNSDPP